MDSDTYAEEDASYQGDQSGNEYESEDVPQQQYQQQQYHHQEDCQQYQQSSYPSSCKAVRFTGLPSSPPEVRDYSYGVQPLNPRAAAATAASTASPRSPLLKKFAPVQDRRVNTILLEALQLTEFTKEELVVVDKSIRRLRDAIQGFAILVDKQVNIIGAESLEERGRVKADIQDLCENLRTSNALLESTTARMKKYLLTGKNQIHAHKRRLVGKAAADLMNVTTSNSIGISCAAHQCSTNELNSRKWDSQRHCQPQPSSPHQKTSTSPARPSTSNRSLYGLHLGASVPLTPPPSRGHAPSPDRMPPALTSPVLACMHSPSKVPLASILEHSPNGDHNAYAPPEVYLSAEFFHSVMDAVGISEKEFLEPKDMVRFIQEMLMFSVARSSVLTFMGKAHHRQLIPKYANELVRLILHDLQPAAQALSTISPVIVPQNTFFDYMCTAPFRFNRLMHELHVTNTSPSDGTSFFTAASAFVVDPIDPLTGVGTNPFAEKFTRNGGILNGGKVVSLVTSKPAESDLLETAEQTLNIAKMLHDLATAESEARHGNRISIRPNASQSKEFSKVYIAASKELMMKESGLS